MLCLHVVHRRAFVPFVTWYRFWRDGLKTLVASIDFIQGHMKTNGGSSMMDKLNRIEALVMMTSGQHRAMMIDHPQGIFTTDAGGRTDWVNRTYCRLLGVTMEESVGFNWKNFIYDDTEREAYFIEWEVAVRDRREFIRVVRCSHATNGTMVYLKVRAYPFASTQGNAGGYIGMVEPAVHS
jgi:PAS domain S-box-containing protein